MKMNCSNMIFQLSVQPSITGNQYLSVKRTNNKNCTLVKMESIQSNRNISLVTPSLRKCSYNSGNICANKYIILSYIHHTNEIKEYKYRYGTFSKKKLKQCTYESIASFCRQ